MGDPQDPLELLSRLDALALVACDGAVVKASAALEKAVGAPPGGLTGASLSSLFEEAPGAIPSPGSPPRRLTLRGRTGESSQRVVTVQAVRGDGAESIFAMRFDENPRTTLLLALARAGLLIQAARSEEAIFHAVASGLAPAGIKPILFRLMPDGVSVQLRRCVLPAQHLEVIEGRLGRTLEGIVVPFARGGSLKECIEERRTIFLDTIRPELLSPESFPTGNPQAGIYAPLVVNDAPFGALLFFSPGLTRDDAPHLALFANQVGASLETARLILETEGKNRTLEALNAIARVATLQSPDDLVEAALEIIVRALRCSGGLVRVLQDGVGHVAAQRGIGETTLALARVRLREDTEFLRQLSRGGRPMAADLSVVGERGEYSRAEGWRQFAAVPLQLKGRPLGEVFVYRKDDVPFSPGDLSLFAALAAQLSLPLENTRLFAGERRRLDELSMLHELGREITRSLEIGDVFDLACESLRRISDTTHCLVLLADADRKHLLGTAASKEARSLCPPVVRISLSSDALSARCFHEARPVQITDTSQPGGYHRELAKALQVTALLALPLLGREGVIGTVVLVETRSPRTFRQQEIDRAAAVANQVAAAIENARLYDSLRKSYAELARTQAALVRRERLAALGELSAVVAHEVRNPLGVIFNSVSSLKRLTRPVGEPAMLLDIVHEEADRLNRMVGDLLDFSRPHELSFTPTDLGRLLDDAIQAALAGAERVTLVRQVDVGLPPVPMDARLVRQALLNVLSNAVQAMPRGGIMKVTVTRESVEGRELCRIDVADEGAGIPSELRGRIFEPFFTTKATGTGLGLAVVKRIIEDHRGSVAVDTLPGRGTTFTLRLPL